MYLIKKKVIWSRESKVSKDFEPLAFDDTRLVSNQRINANRILVNKKPHDLIEWSLTIDNLELSDSNNYICQLNSWPYDIYWLKRFMLNVYGWCALFFPLNFFFQNIISLSIIKPKQSHLRSSTIVILKMLIQVITRIQCSLRPLTNTKISH